MAKLKKTKNKKNFCRELNNLKKEIEEVKGILKKIEKKIDFAINKRRYYYVSYYNDKGTAPSITGGVF